MECECCHCEYNTDEIVEFEFNKDRLCPDCLEYARKVVKSLSKNTATAKTNSD